MADLSLVMFGVFLAASAPFVISILISLKPNLSSQTAEDYFLSHRELSVGGFIAATIGYSLQVSSIFLFFLWGIQYGIWPLIMCATWAAGYYVMARLVRSGKLDNFLGLAKGDELPSNGESRVVKTIHGYVGLRVAPPDNERHQESAGRLPGRLAVLTLSLASVIGIAGTMMTEIDYSTQFFLQAVGIETSELVRYFTQISMLLFTTLYVLWGGFKAAVLTDRLQVPAAYVGLGVFTIGLGFYAQQRANDVAAFTDGVAVKYLLVILLVLYVVLLLIRFSAVAKRGDAWSKTTAYLTFGSLLLITTATMYFIPWPAWETGVDALRRLLFPAPFPSQFVFWGGASLLVTNLLWQLIDISSLQRLQAINKKDIQENRSEIAGVITKTGIEAGLGWTLIIACALILKIIGLDDPFKLIQKLLGAAGLVPFLVPVFILTVVVFMLSTISGFISAVAYIAHFDIAPALGIYQPIAERRSGAEIQITRLVTLVCVILIYLGYTALHATTKGDISTMLYAIWSFQLAIAPAVLTSVFTKVVFSPWVVIVSTLSGMVTGLYVATHESPTLLGIPTDQAWAMLPPLAVVMVSSGVFFLLLMCLQPFSKLRAS